MSKDDELWCVHVEGPDDLYAAESKEAAQQHADALNATIARAIAADPSGHWQLCNAVVAPWPYSTESHAADLLRHAKDKP